MALEMIGGATVGAVAGELLSKVLELKDRATCFKAILKSVEETLEILHPIIQVIERQCCELGRPDREMRRLTMIREMKKLAMNGVMKRLSKIRVKLENGRELVSKCLEVSWWDCYNKIHYERQLEKLDESLKRFLTLDMQAFMAMQMNDILMSASRMAPQFALDYTKLTVSIGVIEHLQVHLIMVDFECPMGDCIYLKRDSLSTDVPCPEKVYIGQTRFMMGEFGVNVRGKFHGGKSSDCTIGCPVEEFDGYIFSFSAGSSLRQCIGSKKGKFDYRKEIYSIRQHTLYEGLLWEYPQGKYIQRDSAAIRVGRRAVHPNLTEEGERLNSNWAPSSNEYDYDKARKATPWNLELEDGGFMCVWGKVITTASDRRTDIDITHTTINIYGRDFRNWLERLITRAMLYRKNKLRAFRPSRKNILCVSRRVVLSPLAAKRRSNNLLLLQNAAAQRVLAPPKHTLSDTDN